MNRMYSAFDEARQAAAARGESGEFWGNITGQGTVEIVSALIPVGVASKAGKLAKGAKALDVLGGVGRGKKTAKAAAGVRQMAPRAPVCVKGCPFVTKGWDGWPSNHPTARKMYDTLRRENALKPKSQQYTDRQLISRTNNLLQSGASVPSVRRIKKRTELYKLSMDGASDTTPFFVTADQLKTLQGMKTTEIADMLGLPYDSIPLHGRPFVAEKIIAMQDIDVFESVIAPAAQGSYKAHGGAVQTLVLERSKFTAPSPIQFMSRPD